MGFESLVALMGTMLPHGSRACKGVPLLTFPLPWGVGSGHPAKQAGTRALAPHSTVHGCGGPCYLGSLTLPDPRATFEGYPPLKIPRSCGLRRMAHEAANLLP